MFKNLNKNGNEKARPETPRAQRIIICRPPDGRAALVAECEGGRAWACEGASDGRAALVAECEGGRAWACEGASDGRAALVAECEVLRSRVGLWKASDGGMGSEKISWAVELLANFHRHTGGGGSGGARTAPPRYKCIEMAALMSGVPMEAE